MKRRRIIWVVSGLLVLGALGGGLFVYRQQKMRAQFAQWREEGMAAGKQGDHLLAVRRLEPYLRRNPSDKDALWQYIESRPMVEMGKQGHLRQTVEAVKRYQRLDDSRVEAYRILADLNLKMDKRTEAMAAADALLARSPKDAKAYEVKVQVLVRMRQFEEALKVATAWAAATPADVRAQMQRLSLRGQVGHGKPEIVADAQALRQEHPNDPRFELIQGFAYVIAGDGTEAKKWLQQAAAKPAPDDEFTRILVTQLDILGMGGDSLSVLQNQVNAGGSAEMRYALARRRWELRKWEGVVELTKDLDLEDPRLNGTLAGMRASALKGSGKQVEAAAVEAKLAVRNQPVAKAWSWVLKLADRPATPAELKQAATDLRAALSLDPSNAYLWHYLGEVNAKLGERDVALDAWKKAAGANATWGQPLVRLAEALLDRSATAEAQAVAGEAVRRDQANPAAAIVYARAWAAQELASPTGRIDELLEFANDIQRQLPGEEYTLGIQAQLLVQKGDKEQAKGVLRSAIGKTPAPPEATLLRLAVLSQRLELGLEEECFAASEKAHGTTPQVAYARAVEQFRAGDPARGARVLAEKRAAGANGEHLAWQLARVQYLDLIRDPSAQSEWVTLADANKDDLALQQAALAGRASWGDREFVQRAVDRVRAGTGESGLTWQLAQARLWLHPESTEKQVNEAFVMLKAVVGAHPQLLEARVSLGHALARLKNVDGAIEQFTEAAKLAPDSVRVGLTLAQLLQSKGELGKAKELLDRLAPQLKTAGDRQQAAELLARQGDASAAVAMLEQLQGAAGDRSTEQLLGVLYQGRRQFDKAEEIARRLLEKPDLGAVQFAVSLYLNQGKLDEAWQALAKLDQVQLQPGMKELTWGGFYGAMGDVPKALEQYRAATKVAPTIAAGWRLQANCLLTLNQPQEAFRALADGVRAAPDDASLKAISAQAESLQRAYAVPTLRPVVGAFLNDPTGSSAVPAVELMRVVAETPAGAGDREQLAVRLRPLVDRYPTFLPAHLQLAQAYYAAGWVDEALAVLRKASNTFASSAEPARTMAMVYRSERRWEEALAVLQEWGERAPAEAAAVEAVKAEVLLGTGKAAQAAELLRPKAEAALKDPERGVEAIGAYAVALCRAGRSDAAAAALWPLVEKSPRYRGVWLQLAAEVTAAQEGAEWLERFVGVADATSVPEQAMLAEAWDRLGQKFESEAFRQKAKGVYDGLLARQDINAQVVLVAAMGAERAGDLERAEALYRRTIRMNPNLFAAHNNLAMVIVNRGGDMKQAEAAATEALRLQPEHPSLLDTLAMVQGKSGNPQVAAETIRRAVERDPRNAGWRVKLVEYLLEAGKPAEAAKALEAMDSARLVVAEPLKGQLEELRKKVSSRVGRSS